MIDTCVCCGEYVPEGRQICQRCELIGPKDLLLILQKGAEQDEMDGGPIHGLSQKTRP